MNVNLQEIINKLQTAKGELQKQQRFAQFATGLDKLISHTSEPLMLVVMGSFSTGKSSFINALLGEEIAAVEEKPTTAVVTKFCYGQQDKLLLHFRDGKVQSATPQEFTRMTAVNNEEKLNEVHEKLDYVERQMPLEILKQVSIIDSPGLNDLKEKRSEATERFVSKADTVLWMFSVVQLATREEMAAMDRLTPRLKPIAVVNKMDLLDEEEDNPQEFLAKARQTLNGRVQYVVGISAKYELEGKKENNTLKREIGNFAELEKAVADLVLPHHEKFKLNTLLDELGAYFAAFNRKFAQAKAENEAKKSGSYEEYMENEQAFMQTEDILIGVTSGIWDYCEREAGRNNELALYLLGVLYEGGISVLQDTDKALRFYQKAAMKNHQDAMINLHAYYSNHGSDAAANYWLRKIAEQGLAEAHNNLGNCLYKGSSCTVDKVEAVKWFKKAAEQGHAEAQNHLAYCLDKGIGCAENKAEAFQWFRKAAEQGHAKAQYNLADCLYEGSSCTVDKVEAVKWLKKAAEQGHAEAQNNLAYCLVKGIGCAENKTEAFQWYKKAAEHGYAIAQYNLAYCLVKGIGCAENKTEAFQWYKKAAEHGYAIAQYNLAYCLVKGIGCAENKAEAFQWYKKAAEQGHAEAQYNLADCLYNGIGCAENKAEAFQWYKKAAEQGNADAQNMVGRYLTEGWGGVTKNQAEAVEWYRKAAEQGLAISQRNLGCCLYEGSGYAVDKVEAVKWFRKAAEQGHIKAQYNLAYCLDKGIGCAENKAEAFQWFRKAAEQGHAIAQINLASFLYNGIGCEKNKAEAFQWYKKAAEQG